MVKYDFHKCQLMLLLLVVESSSVCLCVCVHCMCQVLSAYLSAQWIESSQRKI